jgi:hypothetical protein
MRDFDEKPAPKDLPEFWERFLRYVRSTPDINFVAYQLTGSPDGELVAHGGRSVPKRVHHQVVDSVDPIPVLMIGESDARTVRLFASCEMGVELTVYF